MPRIFVFFCWFTWGITAVSWLNFDTVTMWICRPHCWWETREMVLYISIFTLLASICTTVLNSSRFVRRKILAHHGRCSAAGSVRDLEATR